MPPASETTSGRLATANRARTSETVSPAVRSAYCEYHGSRLLPAALSMSVRSWAVEPGYPEKHEGPLPANGEGATSREAAARSPPEVLRQELGEVGLEGGLRLRADDGLDDLSAAVHLHRRDRGDAVLHRRLRVVVDVQLDDRDLLRVLGRDRVENRSDRATGAAPFRPEVDHDRLLGVEHLGLERGVGHILRSGHLS